MPSGRRRAESDRPGGSMDDRFRREARWAALLALAFVTAGCSILPGKSPLMKAAPVVEVSAPELRTELRGLATRLPAVVEGAADRALGSSRDPVLRRRAIVFKIN